VGSGPTVSIKWRFNKRWPKSPSRRRLCFALAFLEAQLLVTVGQASATAVPGLQAWRQAGSSARSVSAACTAPASQPRRMAVNCVRQLAVLCCAAASRLWFAAAVETVTVQRGRTRRPRRGRNSRSRPGSHQQPSDITLSCRTGNNRSRSATASHQKASDTTSATTRDRFHPNFFRQKCR
jgi:hypothetical protein